jgi:hypothetical protein
MMRVAIHQNSEAKNWKMPSVFMSSNVQDSGADSKRK